MKKTMTLSCPSGAYDVNTPDSARKYLLPSVAEEQQTLRNELKTKTERRIELAEQRKIRPTPVMGREYALLGERIHLIQVRLNEIRLQFKKQTDETPESMFMRAAHTMLTKEEFDRIKKYAEVMMREFKESVYLES